VNIDALDVAQNSTLHHAALTNKMQVCKYLIEQEANLTIINKDESLAIELASSDELIKYLS
jgi:ankyrin repeat protein